LGLFDLLSLNLFIYFILSAIDLFIERPIPASSANVGEWKGHRNSPVSRVCFTGNSFVVTYGKTKKTETHEIATQADWNAFLKSKSKSRFMATLIERIKIRRGI